jgi:hypothetical protein
MKKVAYLKKATSDHVYYVSAADVADKIIDHMRRGLDPQLFSSSSLPLFSKGAMLRSRSRTKLD